MRRRQSWRTVAALGLCALAAGGCSSQPSPHRNDPRPASPITVTAAITDARVRVSPRSFGAGPVTIVISNQSERAHRITFETDEIGGSAAGIRKSVGPVEPEGTGTLKAMPDPGTYRLSVRARRVEPAEVRVGSPRPSSQHELLLP